MLAADHAARLHKPIVVVKVGRTDAGASMAKAHTGHLTGSDAVISAVFRQFGVIRVDGLDELLDTAASFARTTPASVPKWSAKGPGVCVYAVSGGTGAHLADMVSAAGLRIPPLTKATQAALHDGLIPSYLRVSNPVDCGGPPVADRRGREILDRVLADPNVDILIVPITGAVEMFSDPLTRDLIDVAKTTTKPVFVIWGAPPGTDDTYPRRLLDGGLPVVRRYRSPFAGAPSAPSAAAPKARRILAQAEPGEALSEHASKAVLKAYGIRTSRDALCTTRAEAVRAAKALGYPVVMKISSPDLLHKSDLGLVRVGVDSDRGVREHFDDLLRIARRAVGRAGRIEGVLVCEQATGGVEMVVGVSQDELCGPVVMVGLGGVFVEVLSDVTFRVPPFGRDEAERMLHELAGSAMLDGIRGAAPSDVSALVDAIMNVQRLALDLSNPEFAEQIGELDVNPLLVRPRGVVALDALVVRK
jgi:acyl-CoA synthetase (NDP forming)